MHSAQIVSAMHSDENSGDAQRCQNSAVKCRCGVPLCIYASVCVWCTVSKLTHKPQINRTICCLTKFVLTAVDQTVGIPNQTPSFLLQTGCAFVEKAGARAVHSAGFSTKALSSVINKYNKRCFVREMPPRNGSTADLRTNDRH